ncbi:hypothetical protein GJW-30_1_03161 [Variibacter gotjawalensis]|uniref:Alpha/beta hydrolase family protein n=1 Tax=Variibacter gotjawalensis TaxID=1333996 RepID=A0A0S3PXD9_9BRAD|nr:hypothetical protein [Variibacter gotjawalensis]NIK46445.1 hypothetical protein [Variibacter gotjawalensis]RZS48355.1 hypothetical protein EV661_0765 [Variibacter gotjawalensis]BAT60613.1 hypothetical protein GJW-30_1_03161 [Variibacter gotjawalensis]
MTNLKKIICGLSFLATVGMGGSAEAEILRAAQMARGVSVTQSQCAALGTAVWAVVANTGYCVRYYVSVKGGKGMMPAVFLQGDKLGTYRESTRSFSDAGPSADIDTERLQALADELSSMTRTTGIYLARPGVDGSAGHHGDRRSWLELYIVHVALDAIKKKDGYTGFHLVGQSGGAALVGGLIFMRADIGCAVPGAGRLALLGETFNVKDPLRRLFDPVREVATIARRTTRIIVVTDPEDRLVKAKNQNAFVNAVRKAGGRVEQFYVQATDEDRHGVRRYAFRAIEGCIKGESQQHIAMALEVLRQLYTVQAVRSSSPKKG